MDIYSLWDKVLVEFELNLSKNHFDTWFKNTCPVRQDDSVLIISVPNEFVREWVTNNYSKDILKKFSINEANDLYFSALDLNQDLKKFEKDNWFFSGSGSSFFKIL